jgi:hypothetical protein
MNGEQFVKALKMVVRDNTISGLIENFKKPPGRHPTGKFVNLSKWYLSLSDSDKEKIKEVIELAVDSSVFGILAVLDGVRAIEDDCSKGRINLTYVNGSSEILLNDPQNEYLHDMYQNFSK